MSKSGGIGDRWGMRYVLGRLVDHDGVVGLVLYLTLGPLLLLTM